jgi:hypothetical protein
MRRVAAAIAVTATLALLPACSGNDGPGKGEAFLHVDGVARVVHPDGKPATVTRRATLHDGDLVSLVEGTGELELPAGARLTMREGRGGAADSRVRLASVPSVEAGEVLVEAPGTLDVTAAGTRASIDGGAARLSRSLAVGIATYQGSSTLDSAGVVRTVPALRQVDVPALGRVPRALQPLGYDAGDPWDRRFLGRAIDLGERLQTLSRAYTASFAPTGRHDAAFFRSALPALSEAQGFDDALLAKDPGRPVGETLVGAAIASIGRAGSFTHRWSAVFSFRDAGASWGIVALDQRVSGSSVVAAVEGAINTSPFEFALPVSSPAVGTTTATTVPFGPTGTVPPPTTPTTTPPTVPPPTTPPTTPPPTTPTIPPPTTPPPPDTPDQLDPVVQPVEDVLSGVIGETVGPAGAIPILGPTAP